MSKSKINQFKQGPRLVRDRLQGKVFLVPALVTVTGIFCGFLAILSAIKGDFDYAAKCVALAMLLDGLDGRVARRLNATSEFGRELDSLSDVVAFGAAPAVVSYIWAFREVAPDFGILVSFLFVACGALRLARFNITPSDKANAYFEGLPIPAAAAAFMSVVFWHPQPVQSVFSVSLIICYSVVLSVLMVSTFPYMSVKKAKLTQAQPRRTLALVALVVALVWYHSRSAIFLLTLGFALSGPIAAIYRKVKGKPFSPNLDEEVKTQ